MGVLCECVHNSSHRQQVLETDLPCPLGLATMYQRCRTKADPVNREHLLSSLLTSEPIEAVGSIHPKAMPVILTTLEEYDV